MNKLYYIVCDDKDTTLFEGRYQGRSRGGALKFLKQSLGRKSLNGLVFTITEIPVPLIREIVAEILAGGDGAANNVVPINEPQPEPKVTRFDAFTDAPEPEVTPSAGKVKASKVKPSKAKPKADSKPAAPEAKVGNPGHGDEIVFWRGRLIRAVAALYHLSKLK